jgi:[acyl-carrier-protein] S-malonyltransferase/trans-AT polyketide synthase/acyltransferase/oxidoreductase domain-containing protein
MSKEGAAVVFPGQGSQRPGMGKDFFDAVAVSRQVFEEASDALGWDVAALCFGEDEKLNLTEYTQPCLVTTEIAMLRGIKQRFGFEPVYFGGHSLGEFAALVAAGVLPLAETVKIVQARGRLMQQAVPVGVGAMAAVISKNINIDAVRSALGDLPIDLGNINSANQVVISGAADAMTAAQERLTGAAASIAGGEPLRFVALNVSAPFHSRFMKGIEEPFRSVLHAAAQGLDPANAARVASNYTGGFHRSHKDDIINNLVCQLSHSVRWKANMDAIAVAADPIYEVGPNRPLRDFFKTIDVAVSSVINLSSAEKLFQRQ